MPVFLPPDVTTRHASLSGGLLLFSASLLDFTSSSLSSLFDNTSTPSSLLHTLVQSFFLQSDQRYPPSVFLPSIRKPPVLPFSPSSSERLSCISSGPTLDVGYCHWRFSSDGFFLFFPFFFFFFFSPAVLPALSLALSVRLSV